MVVIWSWDALQWANYTFETYHQKSIKFRYSSIYLSVTFLNTFTFKIPLIFYEGFMNSL